MKTCDQYLGLGLYASCTQFRRTEDLLILGFADLAHEIENALQAQISLSMLKVFLSINSHCNLC